MPSTLSPPSFTVSVRSSDNTETGRLLDSLQSSATRRRLGLDFHLDDCTLLSELGRGNGGVVSKTMHKATGFLMTQKIIELDIQTAVRAQILRDLQVLSGCASPYIVDYYGASYVDKMITICMEYMDTGGLDALLPVVGRFPEPIVIQIAHALLQGLIYLWQELHIMHRNLKPSNVLLNRSGAVKLCDFVVSLSLTEALASGFIGLRTYSAPERVAGEVFNATSDVWSLGLILMELAIGCYPIPAVDPVDFVRTFAPDLESNRIEHWQATRTGERLAAVEPPVALEEQITLLALYTYVVERPAPRLPAYCFSSRFNQFIHSCLRKDPSDRLGIELLHTHILPSLITSCWETAIILPSGSVDTGEEDDSSTVTVTSATRRRIAVHRMGAQPRPLIPDYLSAVFNRQEVAALQAVDDNLMNSDGRDDEYRTWNLPSTLTHALPTTTS